MTLVNWQNLLLWWPSHWMRLFWVAVVIVVVRLAVRWYKISVHTPGVCQRKSCESATSLAKLTNQSMKTSSANCTVW